MESRLFVLGSQNATLCRTQRRRLVVATRLSWHIELMVHAPSPSVVCDPDAIDMESAEEGWRSEDPKRRGVAARCTDGVLSDPGRCAAPPARNSAALDAARTTAPQWCRHRSRPRRRVLGPAVDVVDDPCGLRGLERVEVDAGLRARHRADDGGDGNGSGRERVVPTGAHDREHDHAHDATAPFCTGTGPRCRGGGAETGDGAETRARARPGAPPEHDGGNCLLVRRAGRDLCQSEPSVRDGGHGDRPLDGGVDPVHGRRPGGAQSRAGRRPLPGHVLRAGEPGGGRDRGAPDLVTPATIRRRHHS